MVCSTTSMVVRALLGPPSKDIFTEVRIVDNPRSWAADAAYVSIHPSNARFLAFNLEALVTVVGSYGIDVLPGKCLEEI